jgi:hypothetical protein
MAPIGGIALYYTVRRGTGRIRCSVSARARLAVLQGGPEEFMNSRKLRWRLGWCAVWLAAAVVGCVQQPVPATDGGGTDGSGGGNGTGGNGGNTPPATLTIVKTDIVVDPGVRVEAGDDIVVYGLDVLNRVDYLIPSAGDREGLGITDGPNYRSASFAVAAKKIALVNTQTFIVVIFDTLTRAPRTIPFTEIQLNDVPRDVYAPGHIQADGPYVVVRNAPASGNLVKVIDTTELEPRIIAFAVDPPAVPWHIAIDGEAAQVVAAVDDTFYLYDINEPMAAPASFNLRDVGGIDQGTIFKFDNGYVFYKDGTEATNAAFLNVSDGTITVLTENGAAEELAVSNTQFGYFLNRDANDSVGAFHRSGIGTVPGPNAFLAAANQQIDGATDANGLIGWGQAVAISPNGAYTLISGKGALEPGDYLQISLGAVFATLNDPEGTDPYALPGTDVSVSDTCVAFKTGTSAPDGSPTRVGYVVLP